MKRIIILNVIILLSLSLGTGSAPVSANSSLVAESLVKKGKEHFRKGDYGKAVKELSKALLIDPYNEDAKEYLNRMGLKKGIYGDRRTSLDHIHALSGDVQNYRELTSSMREEMLRQARLNQLLQEDKVYFQRALKDKEFQNIHLNGEVKRVQQSLERQAERDQEMINEIRKNSRNEIVRLNANLYDMKTELVKREEQVKESQERIKEYNQKLKDKSREWQKERMAYEYKLLASEDKLNRFNVGLARREKAVKELRDALRKQRMEAAYAHDRLLFADYKLSNREHAVAQKDKKIFELKDSLSELANEVDYLKDKIKRRVKRDDTYTAENIFADDEMRAKIRKQDDFIESLKDELFLAKETISNLEDETREAGMEKVTALKKQLKDMERRLKETTSALSERNEDYQLLEARLKDTRERLDLVEDLMRNKEEQLQQLDDSLNDALLEGVE